MTSNAGLWFSFCCLPESAVEQTAELSVIWDAMPLIWLHFNAMVYMPFSVAGCNVAGGSSAQLMTWSTSRSSAIYPVEYTHCFALLWLWLSVDSWDLFTHILQVCFMVTMATVCLRRASEARWMWVKMGGSKLNKTHKTCSYYLVSAAYGGCFILPNLIVDLPIHPCYWTWYALPFSLWK